MRNGSKNARTNGDVVMRKGNKIDALPSNGKTLTRRSDRYSKRPGSTTPKVEAGGCGVPDQETEHTGELRREVPTGRGERLVDCWVAQSAIALQTWGDENTRRSVERGLQQVTAGLSGPNPSPVELLLAQTAALNWLSLRILEGQYLDLIREGTTLRLSEHHQRRIDRIHRRLMSALRTLATVLRLALPVLAAQVNIAGQQVVANG
jgi:hypothetical protein